MRTTFTFIVILLLFSSCKQKLSSDNPEILATIDERILTRSAVTSIIPRGVSYADSLIMAENITEKWIKDALVYDVALNNLSDEKEEINKLVEDYRRSLVRYRYQERLLRQKLSVNIRESDKLNYYEENQKKFTLDKSLIKGLFLKVPVDAPNLSEVKGWYKQTSVDALEKIEKYSVQNAVIYDYFYDRWVDFDEVMDAIPLQVSDSKSFLKTNKHLEVQDSTYCYLLNISEYIPAGSVAPYDYATAQIVEILTNQQKVDFIKKFEDELYNDAIRSGKVRITSEP